MNKTLIAFGTRYGATAKSSEVIAQVLKDKFYHEVEVVKLSSETENVDIAIYDNVIVGTSLAMFSWTKRAKKFLKTTSAGRNYSSSSHQLRLHTQL